MKHCKDCNNSIGGCGKYCVDMDMFEPKDKHVNSNIQSQYGDNPFNFGRQGWICPKCGAVLSPDMSFCPFCAPKKENTITYGTNTNPPINLNKEQEYETLLSKLSK